MTELEREIDKSIIIVGDFNIFLPTKQLIEELVIKSARIAKKINNITKQQDPTNLYRSIYSEIVEYILSTYGTNA
jgi:hypothetical protein